MSRVQLLTHSIRYSFARIGFVLKNEYDWEMTQAHIEDQSVTPSGGYTEH